MGKRYTLGNKTYVFGKSKSSGMYAVWEQKKTGYAKIRECATIDELKSYIRHLKDLAARRESRQMVADICGTSYRSAMRDMGN